MIWLYRAEKLIDQDVAILKEIDYIASVFGYFSSEQNKKHVSGEK